MIKRGGGRNLSHIYSYYYAKRGRDGGCFVKSCQVLDVKFFPLPILTFLLHNNKKNFKESVRDPFIYH